MVPTGQRRGRAAKAAEHGLRTNGQPRYDDIGADRIGVWSAATPRRSEPADG